MTETAPAPRLFDALRVDPKKVAEGVWIEHPETGDAFLVRRLWCAEHTRAFLQACDDYDARHGGVIERQDGTKIVPHETDEGRRHVDAVAIATGLIVGWRLVGAPDRPYDAAAMTAALLDPELQDLAPWIRLTANGRQRFRPDRAAGN